MTTIRPLQHLHRVYCAGPLFNAAERAEMLQIADLLRGAGFEPFVPHADGMEFSQVLAKLHELGLETAQAAASLHAAIFAMDPYQVCVGCGSLVFNMNGRVPDEGAVAEATMAWMLGKPVVVYKEDVRTMIAGRDNPLVVGPARFETVSQLEELARAMADKIAHSRVSHDWEVPVAPHLSETLTAGERLWHEIERAADRADPVTLAGLVRELFGPQSASPSPQPARRSVGIDV